MKKLLPLLALSLSALLTACAMPHIEGTPPADTSGLAMLNSPDREARLFRLDGTRVDAPAFGSYFVNPGERKLQFQLQLAAGGPPGKNHTMSFTSQSEFLEACLDLKPGYEYSIEVDRSRPERALVINERSAQAQASTISSTC